MYPHSLAASVKQAAATTSIAVFRGRAARTYGCLRHDNVSQKLRRQCASLLFCGSHMVALSLSNHQLCQSCDIKHDMQHHVHHLLAVAFARLPSLVCKGGHQATVTVGHSIAARRCQSGSKVASVSTQARSCCRRSCRPASRGCASWMPKRSGCKRRAQRRSRRGCCSSSRWGQLQSQLVPSTWLAVITAVLAMRCYLRWHHPLVATEQQPGASCTQTLQEYVHCAMLSMMYTVEPPTCASVRPGATCV